MNIAPILATHCNVQSEWGLLLYLQVLPDDPRDDAQGDAPLHIQMGDGKRYIILFPGRPVVIAGVGHRVDTIGKPDIDHALVYIGHFPGVFALDTAFLQVVPVRVLRCAFDVGTDAKILQTVAPHTEDADQHFVAHGETLMGVADPVPCQIAGQNRRLDAEHLYTNDFLRYRDDAGLNDAPLVNAVLALGIQIKIEGLALPHHGLTAAGDYAAGLGVDAAHHKVDVRAQHIPQNLVLAQHQISVLLTGRAAAKVDHHLLEGDDDAESLVIHYGHGLTVVQLLDAAQLPCEDAAGAVGVVDLMPNDILPVLLRFHLFTAANGQNGGFAAANRGGPPRCSRSILRRRALLMGIIC